MKAKRLRWLVPAVLLTLILTTCSFGQSSASFAVKWSCLSSGGAMSLASSSFRVSGTIGQSVAGSTQSASFKTYLGFWAPEVGVLPTEIETLDEAKLLGDGEVVHAIGKVATSDQSDFSGFIYIEEPDRSSGIRVAPSSVSGTLVRGSLLEVTGTMATTVSGERFVDAASVTVSGSQTLLSPLGMTNKTLGGGNFGDPGADAGQYGVAGGTGTNTIGLLVQVWGKATVSGGTTTLDDGSGTSVTLDTSRITGLTSGKYYSVEGISTLGSGRTRLVAPRDNADVTLQE